MAYEARYVFKPAAGCDFPALMELVKEGAAYWQKHGAPKPTLWTITAGEMGNMVFSMMFDDAAHYGRVADKWSTDPEALAWQAKAARGDLATWVRSNLARQLPL